MDIKELKVAGNKNHPWEYARSRVVNRIVARYLTFDRSKAAWDVGCGDVFFLSKFHETFPAYSLMAVDVAFDDEIIERLSKKYAAYNILFFKNINDVKKVAGKAAVIFLLDVIEHVEDDVDFLKSLACKPFVDKDTLIVVTVPAFNSLYVERDKWLGHYRRYSRKMLTNHIGRAGLSEVEGGYFFFSLLILRAVQKLLEVAVKPKNETGIGSWKGGRAVSFLYEKLLLCDFYISLFLKALHIKLPGLSAYTICKLS
ncbi:MAG: class I SAM-dependent methyltransferase [Prevotellaceae bacterium]|jgi:hypothetical protein|nr:class I SAM-dependent methyltransferase [Prevotellaceae bacterium]